MPALPSGMCSSPSELYMPDFKFWDEKWAERYCNAPDYREKAVKALKEMYAQK